MMTMMMIMPTVTLGLFTLALMLTPLAAEESMVQWQDVLPHLDTFSSYEDMQRYFDHRNQRSLRQLDNPLEDSYVEAFNRHNEQEAQRPKRSTVVRENKELTNPPSLIKFEMADAVEPSEEVKDLIRQYRSREMQIQNKPMTSNGNLKSQEPKPKPIFKRTAASAARTSKNPVSMVRSSFAKPPTRPKRSAIHQQPANFKVQLIPFDETDAREPNEQTKALIKRMRALDIEKITKDIAVPDLPSVTHVTAGTTKKPLAKRSKYNKLRKPKRTKRSAPEMIKFELTDAKDPNPALNTFKTTNTKQGRVSKDLKLDKKDEEPSENKAVDQKSQASKRYFVYKEAPAKVKKSVSALPHDVQNIISHIIKNQGNGKALVKYIPAKQMDYNQFKLAYQAPKAGYGHGGNAYVKYVAAPAKAEQVQVQIHSVPVVEKVRYIYTPVAVEAGGEGGGAGHSGEQQAGYAHGGSGEHAGLGAHASAGYEGGGNAHNAAAGIAHPIVVAEEGGGGGGQKSADVHYAYAAALPEAEGGKAGSNYVPAADFKAANPESKYSVEPTVEHYSKAYTNNVQTQDFQYKIYSPEALLLKAQLEAKEKLEAIKAEAQKAQALIDGHGGGGNGGGGHGGGGHGGGGHGGGGHGGGGHGGSAYAAGGHGGGKQGGHGGGGYGGGGHGGGGHGGGEQGLGGHGGGGYAGGGHGGGEQGGGGHGGGEQGIGGHGGGGYGGGGHGGGEQGLGGHGGGGNGGGGHGGGEQGGGGLGGGEQGGGGHAGAGYGGEGHGGAVYGGGGHVGGEQGGAGHGGVGYVGGGHGAAGYGAGGHGGAELGGGGHGGVGYVGGGHGGGGGGLHGGAVYVGGGHGAGEQAGGGHGGAGYGGGGHGAAGYVGVGHGGGGHGGGGHGGGEQVLAGYGGGGHGVAVYGGGGHGGAVYGGGGHGGAGYGGGGHGGAGYGGGGHGGAGYGGGGHGGAGYGGGGHGGVEGGEKYGAAGEGQGPVIKIEYHAPADNLKENYKEMPEFKQLSSLVGKSPEDQIHGLTYLLAKEMQSRLHAKKYGAEGGAAKYGGEGGAGKYGGEGGNYGGEGGAGKYGGEGAGGKAGAGYGGEGRPQDNKSPILFHPEDAYGGGGKGEGGGHVQQIMYQPGKLIGMAKSKQYIPVIEPSPADDYKAAAAALAIVGKDSGSGEGGSGGGGEGKGYNGGGPHSYIAYGLSPNYKGFASIKMPAAGGAANQKDNGKQGYVGVGANKGLHEAGYDSAVQKLQSYASKYAFGYRIRDFSTGNDFGHNQNRDLNGVTRGQYHILLPDGRIQNVIYHADDTGFHADVSFEGDNIQG